MVDIEVLLSRIEGLSFIDLALEEQQTLALIIRPEEGEPFHKAQQYLLANIFLIVDPAKEIALSALNLGRSNIASTIDLRDGRKVLPASLLSNCRPDEPFGHLREFLFGLPFSKLSDSDFPEKRGMLE